MSAAISDGGWEWTEKEESYSSIWYMIFLSGLISNMIVHVIAAFIALFKLRHHPLGRAYYPIFLIVFGFIGSVTGIAVTSVVIAGIYRAASFVFLSYHAVVLGVVQTLDSLAAKKSSCWQPATIIDLTSATFDQSPSRLSRMFGIVRCPPRRSTRVRMLLSGLLLTLFMAVIGTSYALNGNMAAQTRLSALLIEGEGVSPVLGAHTMLTGKYYHNRIYGIMFDAGSTGSRVHVYEMQYEPSKPQPYTLLGELFEQVKPGLSSFADDPQAAARSLAPLLEAAKRRVPPAHRKDTHMALRATAGLRLLPVIKSKNILQQVHHYLNNSVFHLVSDGVSIMEGVDEGIYSWVTLNFLANRLTRPTSSYGALDLGGGSTQITMIPSANSHTIAEAPRGFLRKARLDKAVLVYSHSYLGLGLMSARLQILGGEEGKNHSLLKSPCLPTGYKGTWSHGGRSYDLEVDSENAGYEGCYSKAQQLVTNTYIIDHPDELKSRVFYAFSYFYDRAVDARLISESEGGQVILESFLEAAKKECGEDTSSNKKPFLCLDLCYISALLKDGYRFPISTGFVLKKKINSVELSWGLGAMFDVLKSNLGNVPSNNPTVQHSLTTK